MRLASPHFRRSRTVLGALSLLLGVGAGVPVVSIAATTTIGPSPLHTESLTNDSFRSGTYIEYSGMTPAPEYVAPIDGTIVSWQIATGSSGVVRLRVLRPVGEGKFTGVGTSAETTAATGLNTFSTSLPIKAGDVIGVENNSEIIMFDKGHRGEYPSLFSSGLGDGSPAAAPQPLTPEDDEFQLQISAQIEPTQSTGTGPPPVNKTGGGTVPVTPGGVKQTQSAPTLAGLRTSPNAFGASPSGNTIAGGKKGTGTTVSYTDSQVATTTLTILQSQPGHRTPGGACVKPALKHHEKRCTRVVALAHFARADGAGANRLHFTGRINGRRLQPGRYELRATARNAFGLVSRPVVDEFRILGSTSH
jgi:hypothetical protein